MVITIEKDDIIECHHEETITSTHTVDFMNHGEADNEEIEIVVCANPLCSQVIEG